MRPNRCSVAYNLLAGPGKGLVIGNRTATSTTRDSTLLDLNNTVATCGTCIVTRAARLIASAGTFASTVGTNSVRGTGTLCTPAHRRCRHVRPVTRLFSSLSNDVSTHRSSCRRGTTSPGFANFRHLRGTLFNSGAAGNVSRCTSRLCASIISLRGHVDRLTFPPSGIINNTTKLVRRITTDGVDNRRSHCDRASL